MYGTKKERFKDFLVLNNMKMSTNKIKKIGYARVSTSDQDVRMQQAILEEAGCEQIYTDQGVSGVKAVRPGLEMALTALTPGDALVIYKLDRLGRSLKDLLKLVEDLKEKNIQLISLTEQLDTTTPQGRLIFNVFASISEFERSLIGERTKAGVAAAKAAGATLGRPKAITEDKLQKAVEMLRGGVLTMQEIANRLHVGRTTLYKAIGQHKEYKRLIRRYPKHNSPK